MKFFYFIALFGVIAISTARAQTNADTNAIVKILPTAKTNAPAIVQKQPRGPMTISSDSGIFKMDTRETTYRGHVRVNDPQMKLTCEKLIADLAKSGARIDHIVAETNVVIDFTNEKGQVTHATSDKAIYDFNVKNGITNETVTLTGHAKVENEQTIITAEPIVWDRASDRLIVTNEQMIFRQIPSDVLAKTNSPAANTNHFSLPK